MSYNVVNILDLIEMLGEAPVQAALSDFSCPKNPDIERFLQQNAIPFARRKISMTHLVFFIIIIIIFILILIFIR